MKHFSDSNPDATYKVFSGEIIFNFNDLSRLLLSDSIKHLKKKHSWRKRFTGCAWYHFQYRLPKSCRVTYKSFRENNNPISSIRALHHMKKPVWRTCDDKFLPRSIVIHSFRVLSQSDAVLYTFFFHIIYCFLHRKKIVFFAEIDGGF